MSPMKQISALARLGALLPLFVLSACASSPPGRIEQPDFLALEADIARHIDVLASEEFGGRRPGTIGETRTLDYMRHELEQAGYVSGTNDPGNPWNAPVTLASVAWSESAIEIRRGRRTVTLDPHEAAAFTERRRSLVEGGEMIFVGFAANALSDETIRGRVVIMLGEPGESPHRRAELMTQGPAAIVTVVEDQASIDDLRSFNARERLILAQEIDNDLTVFATTAAMETAFGASKWAKLVASAESGRETGLFEPQQLDGAITIDARAKRREVPSHNFIARLPGSDPGAGAILLLAHWDHFGTCGAPDDADRLCNGAVDNASGIALMIELAKRLAQDGPLARDIYVLGTTAEEWGLLGAQAFAEEPPMPLESIVAAFNFDTVAIGPRGSAVGYIGEGLTPLDSLVKQAVNDVGRELAPRERVEPFLQRQDGWALLQRDVPAVLLSNAFGDKERLMAFLTGDYHKASDEPGSLELGGAVDDLLLHELLIRRIADPAKFP